MTRLYSTFDPANLGANMALEQSNTIVATTGIGSIDRQARFLYPKSSGLWMAEFGFYGDEPLENHAVVGVVDDTVPLTTYAGATTAGRGYLPGNGLISDGTKGGPSTEVGLPGDVIGVLVNLGDGSAPTVSWYLNGIPLLEVSLPHGGPWYLSGTVSTSSSDELRLWVNTGQRDFEFPIPGAAGGWFDLSAEVPAILVATDDYVSPADDTVPNEIWDGRISDEGFEIVSELRFSVDGGSSARGSASRITLAHDGDLDWAVTADARDSPVLLESIERGASYDTATPIASMIIDEISVVDETSIRITMVSSIALLDAPLQTKFFPPSADPVVAGKPWPYMFGAVRSAPPVLVDPANLIYALADTGVVAIGWVRDMGAPLDPLAMTPGWTIGADPRTIVLATDPVGDLTADVSSIGGEIPVTTAEDVWLSHGNPFHGTGSTLAGFDANSGAALVSTNKCRFTSPSLSGSAYISLTTAECTAGRSYRYRVNIQSIPGTHAYGVPSVSIDTGFPSSIVAWSAPGIYSGVFTAPFTFIPYLKFKNALTGSQAVINSAYILEIPDDYDPSVIQPGLFSDFMQDVIERKAKRPHTSWSLEDALAIDAVGYSGIGFYDTGSITARRAIESVLSTWTACAWMNENDVLRFSRLVDPDTVTPVGEILEADLLGEIGCEPDFAPGLSNQMRCRKNWFVIDQANFVSDYITVPGEVRRALSQPYQHTVASSLPLAAMYAQAVYREPIDTLGDNPVDAQTEIDRLCAYYGVPRFFYPMLLPEEFAVELGQVWTVYNSRYNLALGRNLMVCRKARRPLDGTVQIILRG